MAVAGFQEKQKKKTKKNCIRRQCLYNQTSDRRAVKIIRQLRSLLASSEHTLSTLWTCLLGKKTLGAEVVLSQQGVYVLLPDKLMQFIPCEPPSGCIDFAWWEGGGSSREYRPMSYRSSVSESNTCAFYILLDGCIVLCKQNMWERRTITLSNLVNLTKIVCNRADRFIVTIHFYFLWLVLTCSKSRKQD